MQDAAVEGLVSGHTAAGVDADDGLDEIGRASRWRLRDVNVVIFMEDDVAAGLEDAVDLGDGFGWVGGVHERLHGVDAVEGLVGEIQRVVVAPLRVHGVLHALALDFLLGPDGVVGCDVDGLDVQALVGEVEGYVTDATTGVEDLCAGREVEGFIEIVLHPSKGGG